MTLWKQISQYDKSDTRFISFVNGEQLTYLELFDRVDTMAQALADHVQVGEIVLMDGVKSSETICTLLACVRNGYGYSFLDPSLPEKRRNEIILAIRPAVYLQQGNGAFVRQLQNISDTSSENRRFAGSIVFTSGSTGVPKGVLSSYEALSHYVDSMIDIMGTEPDNWLSICPVYFDVVQLDVLVQLARGANIVFASHSLLPHQYLQILEQKNITSVLFISTLLKMICQVGSLEHKSKLKTIYFGGEGCSVYVLERAMSKFPGVEFCQFYGPTENCNNTTFYKFNDLRKTSTGFMPLGSSVKHVEIEIVDDSGIACPPGQIGELVFGGKQLFSGYLDVNSGHFQPHKAETYSSKDLGFRDEEGLIWFTGRKDDLIKINGNRVSLNEINSKIQEVINNATVSTVAQEKNGFRTLVSGVHSPEFFETQTVIDHLKSSLPKYCVPSKVLQLPDEVVTTLSTGKTNYKAIEEFLLLQT